MAASFAGTQVIMLWTLLLPLQGLSWSQGFRSYFSNDQLSYAAIAVTASKGNLLPVEPLTETGVSHYPSLWYLLLGLTSNITGFTVWWLWSVLGLTLVGLVLGILGYIAYRYSQLAIAPLLPGLALITGTLAIITTGSWFTNPTFHAVLWGPFGTLFTLNAEAIGLMVNITIAALVLSIAGLPMSTKTRVLGISTAAALLGTLANVQTYAFLAGTTLIVAFAATFALLRYPSKQRAALTILLVSSALVLGPFLSSIIGPLPLIMVLFAATLPATLPLMRANKHTTIIAAALFALFASPQVIRTFLGLMSQDDFLTYRQASTEDLGVPLGSTIVGLLPIIAIAGLTVFTLIATRHRVGLEHRAITALLISLTVSLVIMTTNDQWGFNQEPYRFLLQYFIITTFLLSITTAWSIKQWFSLEGPARITSGSLALVALLLWSVSLGDVWEFRSYARDQGVIALEDGRSQAIRELITHDVELVLSSRCTDPQVLKLVSAAPVAFFNRGLAWPENRVAIDALMDRERSPELTVDELWAAGITHVFTDSLCSDDWQFADARVQPGAVTEHENGLFTLWRVASAG